MNMTSQNNRSEDNDEVQVVDVAQLQQGDDYDDDIAEPSPVASNGGGDDDYDDDADNAGDASQDSRNSSVGPAPIPAPVEPVRVLQAYNLLLASNT
jgi:hypothetical protein